MPGELVFEVVGASATPATPVTLVEAGLRERRDLQEWVLAHPVILGPDVMIIAFEFDRWSSASGDRERDRLDVLGLGSDGRLVVAELKRDRAPETVNMQALKYAAMASRFTDETLVQHYLGFRTRAGQHISEEEAREELLAHAGDLDPEQLRKPRIVLVAGAFPTTVTATAVWLSEMGLDISLQRVQAYRLLGESVVITVSQLFPVPDVEEFAVSPQRAQVKATEERRKSGREQSTVHKLVASTAVADGTPLTLEATEVPPDIRVQVEAWVAEDSRRGRATWFNDVKNPLRWEYDGQTYRPTPLVAKILVEAAEVERSPRGPAWWVLPNGLALNAMAASLAGARGTFDWSVLHSLLSAIPSGRWTTYGDLAAAIGTAPQPLGQHMLSCPECQNAHRVLSARGRVSDGFTWSDPDDARDPVDLLQSEGLSMSDGIADARARMRLDEFAATLHGGDSSSDLHGPGSL